MKNDPQPWTILHSEYLIRRPWLTARRDHVRLPNGSENPEHYVLEYPDWINIIAIDKEGCMLLVRQYRHGLGRTNFELVAGVLEKDEDPLTAAKRELLEETGYSGGEWHELMQLSANSSTMTNITTLSKIAKDTQPMKWLMASTSPVHLLIKSPERLVIKK